MFIPDYFILAPKNLHSAERRPEDHVNMLIWRCWLYTVYTVVYIPLLIQQQSEQKKSEGRLCLTLTESVMIYLQNVTFWTVSVRDRKVKI